MKAALVVTLSVSLSALMTLWIADGRTERGAAAELALVQPDSVNWESLAARLEALEELGAEPARLAPIPDARRTPIQSADGESFERRIAQLEERMERLMASLESERSSLPAGRSYDGIGFLLSRGAAEGADDELEPEAERLALNATILNHAASDAEKIDAHRSLRRVEDAYEPGTVRELLRIAQNATDPEVRASAWTNFDGATDVPNIVPGLVQAVRGDRDDEVRVEAAETLGNYLDDPQNLSLLQDIAQHDPVKAVRDRAARELAKHAPTLPK